MPHRYGRQNRLIRNPAMPRQFRWQRQGDIRGDLGKLFLDAPSEVIGSRA